MNECAFNENKGQAFSRTPILFFFQENPFWLLQAVYGGTRLVQRPQGTCAFSLGLLEQSAPLVPSPQLSSLCQAHLQALSHSRHEGP